jgi:hypothetical protein
MAIKNMQNRSQGSRPIDYGHLTVDAISRVAIQKVIINRPLSSDWPRTVAFHRWYLPESKTLRVFPTDNLYCL